MVLILVAGDLHVPQRAVGIPEAFQRLLLPGKIQEIFLTGNLGSSEMYDIFRKLAPMVHCVRGDYDAMWNTELPETMVVEVEGLRMGIVHGHQVIPSGNKDSLAMLQRQLDVDVLLYGNAPASKSTEFDGHLFITPGSITGAPASGVLEAIPSFVLLDVHEDSTITIFTYEYHENAAADDGQPSEDGSNDEGVKIKKKEWSKEGDVIVG